MKRAAFTLLLMIAAVAAVLLGMVIGTVIAFEPPVPAERHVAPMSYPLGCDARMVVSAAGHVYQDRCYVRRNPQVWL